MFLTKKVEIIFFCTTFCQQDKNIRIQDEEIPNNQTQQHRQTNG